MAEIKEQYNLDYNDRYVRENEENRRLWINRDIDDDILDDIVYMILRYNRIDEENMVPKEKRIPIVIYINSNGGCVNSGYSVINTIEASAVPVYTVNVGVCYSMGFLIYLAGDKRYAMKDSTFLMHDGSSGVYFETTSKLHDRLEFEQKMEERTRDYILSHTKFSPEMYDEKYRTEYYFYAKEGKEYGVVDKIIGEDCTIEEVL